MYQDINVENLKIPEVKIIRTKVFEDNRGFFFESYNKKKLNKALGLDLDFVQDNHSKSSFGVLRGMHYQENPYEQGKLVRVIKGEVYDVALDIRKDSKTFGKWVGEYLSFENKKQLWIPPGFAHGFLVTSDHAEFIYKTTKFYNPEFERCIKFDDEQIKIDWPKINSEYIISQKDQLGKKFSEI